MDNDPRAWNAATVDDPSAWYVPLPRICLDLLERTIAKRRREPGPLTETVLTEDDRAEGAASLRTVIDALESGRGFAIIDGLPMDRISREEAQAAYWVVGQWLGTPMTQNVQGTLLYDVRDTGQDVAYGARFSVTNSESSFHTDNSFGESVLDYVGLLCLTTARSGGLNQNVSGYAVYDALARTDPEVL